MNNMIELRKQELKKYSKMDFDTFHSIMCKSMPNASVHPAMYNLCYDLMKLAWETAQKQTKP